MENWFFTHFLSDLPGPLSVYIKIRFHPKTIGGLSACIIFEHICHNQFFKNCLKFAIFSRSFFEKVIKIFSSFGVTDPGPSYLAWLHPPTYQWPLRHIMFLKKPCSQETIKPLENRLKLPVINFMNCFILKCLTKMCPIKAITLTWTLIRVDFWELFQFRSNRL